MHKIAILAQHGVIPFDLTTACDILSRVEVPAVEVPYAIMVCGEAPSVAARHFDLHTRWNLNHILSADTLIVPGIDDLDAPISEAVLSIIRQAASRVPSGAPARRAQSAIPMLFWHTDLDPRVSTSQ